MLWHIPLVLVFPCKDPPSPLSQAVQSLPILTYFSSLLKRSEISLCRLRWLTCWTHLSDLPPSCVQSANHQPHSGYLRSECQVQFSFPQQPRRGCLSLCVQEADGALSGQRPFCSPECLPPSHLNPFSLGQHHRCEEYGPLRDGPSPFPYFV